MNGGGCRWSATAATSIATARFAACKPKGDSDLGRCSAASTGIISNLDDEFAFSLCATREEWEKQQDDYRRFNEKMEAKRREREAAGDEPFASVWKSSYVDEESLREAGGVVAASVMALAMRVAELIGDLKAAGEQPRPDRIAQPSLRRLPRRGRRSGSFGRGDGAACRNPGANRRRPTALDAESRRSPKPAGRAAAANGIRLSVLNSADDYATCGFQAFMISSDLLPLPSSGESCPDMHLASAPKIRSRPPLGNRSLPRPC